MSREIWKPGNMLYPLPAVLVSCGQLEGKHNVFTVAWTGTICTNPAMLYISVRPERYSYQMIRQSGEFVINLTTKKLVRATDYCGVVSGRDIDKFQKMHLTAGKANTVKAPIIEESPVNIECQVTEIKELGSHHMFLAKVTCVDIDSAYMDAKGKFSLKKAGVIAYSHGEYYTLDEKLGTFGYSVKKRSSKKGTK